LRKINSDDVEKTTKEPNSIENIRALVNQNFYANQNKSKGLLIN